MKIKSKKINLIIILKVRIINKHFKIKLIEMHTCNIIQATLKTKCLKLIFKIMMIW
jgi:hypothetical protein